ncbi:AAA family ATPase [Mycobacterium sp. RTGN5]|uniref:AAA family ATPase n=1 Tax=Mycobacterium sp. RTGN5 TaxID=3016522 RepID=UPI0029C7D9BC|nr:AAA family ATPase [Mycobacterium sp. RTGN5]
MSTDDVSRPAEARSVAEFLASAGKQPSALLVKGEAGIGKTTLWSAAVKQAHDRGFRVLSARPAVAESVLAYAALADLLGGVDEAILAALPYPQRHAIDRVLLRAGGDEPTDQRAVAAGFLSIVERLADVKPVLVAIDDVQWLDPSSERVLAFAVRRLAAPVGVLCAARIDPDGGGAASWLRSSGAPFVECIQLAPLTIGSLHAVVSERLGRSFPRPAMVHIQQVSGGNPFYALELARAMADGTTDAEGSLPSTLAELVRARIDSLDGEVHDVLLAAACAAAPTVELLARATDTDAREALRLLENVESEGIVTIDGTTVSFAHPLLARGVYADASPARRRAMHRRLAEVVTESEPAARHLALAATTGDSATWASLDEAAEMARMRGAPAAAAELVDLAVKLGGDTAERRIRSASHHFEAGDPMRARALLEKTVGVLKAGPLLAAALCLLAMVRLTDDSFLDAIGLLERGLNDVGDDLAMRVQMLVTLCFAQGNVGRYDAAAESADDAVADAERLGHPGLLSQALGMQVIAHVVRGDGLDEQALQRALELEDPKAPVPLPFRPSLQNAAILAWTGRLDRAHHEMLAIRHRCIEYGEENELMFLAFHGALIEIWRGDFAEATQIARDAMERARLLGGDLPLFIALTVKAAVAAYAGRVDDARSDATAALEAGQRSHSTTMSVWPDTILGFLEVSHGNYAAAVTALGDQMARLAAAPDGTEVIAASFVPDAVEALIQLDRLTEAEPMIERLERNGARLDRAWMLAVGGRCRAMLLAARGDLEGANASVLQALVEHARLPMPFERARTQLLLGQIHRRQRRKDAATETLGEALASFEAMGAPLWAERVRAELARCVVVPRRAGGLTPAERRVAELAASGMTNRDVAAALFISPKTVEVNLSRVYRKLGIRSRAELGRYMSQADL